MTGQQEQIVDNASGELPGIDLAKVQRWLGEHVAGVQPPLHFGLIGAGGSNLTYRVTDANGTLYILRRPPVGSLLPSAHNLAREHRIMSALRPSAVPVPAMAALCEDESVTGAEFYVMEYVDGLILRDAEAGAALAEVDARRASLSFVDALAAIHTLEPAEVGLHTLSKPDGYVTRQLRRWFTQYEHTAVGAPDPQIVDLHARLAANLPDEAPSRTARLTHGDYHIDNVVFDRGFQVSAVLDWELCTLGDPLADLAWALMFWTTSPDEFSMMVSAPTVAPGFISRSEFTERYAAASKLDLTDLPYFLCLSHWKLACLVQGAVYRASLGQGGGMQAAGQSTESEGLARIRQLVQAAGELAGAAGI